MTTRRRLTTAFGAGALALLTWCSLAGASASDRTAVTRSSLDATPTGLSVGETSASPAVPATTNLLAVQWRGDGDARVVVETRDGDGPWTRVATVGEADGGADTGSPDARAATRRLGQRWASEPVAVRGVDEVRVRVLTGTLRDPRLLAIGPTAARYRVPVQSGLLGGGAVAIAVAAVLLIPGRRLLGLLSVTVVLAAATVPMIATPRRADAFIPQAPPIITRGAWGADESLRLTACPDGPSYTAPQFAVVHHTATSNGDTPAQSYATVRSIYAYYVLGRGYCDHGYNFLIDRFGQIFEGRFGGVDRGVIGAHATNFNAGSIGVALIGDHSSLRPSAAAVSSLVRLLHWKLTIHTIDPNAPVATRGAVIDPVIGHRDAGAISGDTTACPGNAGYSILGAVRTWLRATVRVGVPWSAVDLVQRTPGSVRMAGWALDPETTDPIEVHTYVDSTGARWMADAERPDLAPVFPDRGTAHGFDVTVPVGPGTHTVCAYAISVVRGDNDAMRCLRTSGSPMGFFEAVGRAPAELAFSGWAIDPDTVDPIPIAVWVDGRYVGTTPADRDRPELAGLVPGYGTNHGFLAVLPVVPGVPHTVCLWALSALADPQSWLGCRVA